MARELPSSWLSDPGWLAMDATARGFHAQLVMVAAKRRPAGALPDDDRLWRKWLGLSVRKADADRPLQSKGGILPDSLLASLDTMERIRQHSIGSGASPDTDAFDPDVVSKDGPDEPPPIGLDWGAWINWLWVHRWKPQVLGSWQVIDDTLIEQYPHLSKLHGGWFSTQAWEISRAIVPSDSEKQPGRKRKAATRKASTVTNDANHMAKHQSNCKDTNDVATAHETTAHETTAQEYGAGRCNLTDEPIMVQSWLASDHLRQSRRVWAAWRPPLDRPERQTLWDLAVACLTEGGQNERAARGVIARLIRIYGEPLVGQAVSDLAVRRVAPAEPVSFLTAALKSLTDGKPVERKARLQRSEVAL